MNRRHLLTVAPAAAAAAATSAIGIPTALAAAGHDDARLVALVADWHATGDILDRQPSDSADDPAWIMIEDRLGSLSDAIGETRATGIHGAVAKLRVYVTMHAKLDGSRDYAGDLVADALAALEREVSRT